MRCAREMPFQYQGQHREVRYGGIRMSDNQARYRHLMGCLIDISLWSVALIDIIIQSN